MLRQGQLLEEEAKWKGRKSLRNRECQVQIVISFNAILYADFVASYKREPENDGLLIKYKEHEEFKILTTNIAKHNSL